MFHFDDIDYDNKDEFYEQLLGYVKVLVEGEPDLIADTANISSLLYHMMQDVNWAGFYLYKDDQLVLGPFHGGIACIRIPMGKGVCGTAATTGETQVVKNVHEFPGHIACDSNTNSEIVIPMYKEGRLLGVLDIDSPKVNRFDEIDQKYLEQCRDLIIKAVKI